MGANLCSLKDTSEAQLFDEQLAARLHSPAHRRPCVAHDWLRGAPKVENPQTRSPRLQNDIGDRRRRRAGFLLLPQPCPSQEPPSRSHLKSEIVLLQPVLLSLLGLDALLDGVTPVLSQLRSHLPQLILMRTQLLLLQRQVPDYEVPLSRSHRSESAPVMLDLLPQRETEAWPVSSSSGGT